MANTEKLGLKLRTAADNSIDALVNDYNDNMNLLDQTIGKTEFLDVEFNESEVDTSKSALTAFKVGNILFVNGALCPKHGGAVFYQVGKIMDVRLKNDPSKDIGDVQFPIAGFGGYGEGILNTSGKDILIKTAFPHVDGATAYRLNLTVPVE